ncbi:hypothetical protein H4582DRAFT_2001499 [Lactarius indigo]|nr:hypothetical protein H4582DRAFT_2001499 [Lactarius indigo]
MASRVACLSPCPFFCLEPLPHCSSNKIGGINSSVAPTTLWKTLTEWPIAWSFFSRSSQWATVDRGVTCGVTVVITCRATRPPTRSESVVRGEEHYFACHCSPLVGPSGRICLGGLESVARGRGLLARVGACSDSPSRIPCFIYRAGPCETRTFQGGEEARNFSVLRWGLISQSR